MIPNDPRPYWADLDPDGTLAPIPTRVGDWLHLPGPHPAAGRTRAYWSIRISAVTFVERDHDSVTKSVVTTVCTSTQRIYTLSGRWHDPILALVSASADAYALVSASEFYCYQPLIEHSWFEPVGQRAARVAVIR